MSGYRSIERKKSPFTKVSVGKTGVLLKGKSLGIARLICVAFILQKNGPSEPVKPK